MNNTEKLLMAFIEAQGFHVKETVDCDEQESNEQEYNMYEAGLIYGFRKHYIHEDDNGCLKYMSSLLEPRVNYEVTKKSVDVFLEVDQDGDFKIKKRCIDMDFSSYPTNIRISTNKSGEIEVYRVSKMNEWELVCEKDS